MKLQLAVNLPAVHIKSTENNLFDVTDEDDENDFLTGIIRTM